MKLLFLILPVFLFSCTKDPDITTPPVTDCKLLTVNFDTSAGKFYNLKYDSNKIVQLTLTTDPQTKMVYTFNSLNQFIKREDFNNNDNLGANLVRHRFEHIYDASNKIIRSNISLQSYSGGVALGLKFHGYNLYSYSTGLLSEIKSYSPFNGVDIYMGRTTFTWLNDDLMSITSYAQNGSTDEIVNFTYDLSKENKFDSVLKYFYIQEIGEGGFPMEGIRRSKHVLTSSTQHRPSGPITYTRSYQTTFNSRGFIKSIKENAFGTSYYIFSFTYSCD
jgi:hypothetical protein